MTNKEIEEILSRNTNVGHGIIIEGDTKKIREALNAIKSGIPTYERPTGEWKPNKFDEHYCNKCGNFALWSEEADGYYEVQSNFCPNCGADMREKERKNEQTTE